MADWGGVERLIEDVLTHPAQPGIRHVLLATSWSPQVISSIRAAGTPILLLERSGRFDPRAVARAVAWLRREQVGVVHAYNAYANIWGHLLATLARIPVFVAGEHGTIWRTRDLLYHLDRRAQRAATAVVANSEAAATLVHHRYGVARDKIHIIANAVAPLPEADVASLRRSLGLGDAPVVGSIGRLDSPKDYRTFIDAAALVLARDDRVRFMLVGGGPLEMELRAQVKELDISDRFMMTGFRADARQLIQMFDIFIGTSIRESFGNVFVEAALAGVPVIAPAIDGIPEAVEDGQTGLLLVPKLPVRLPHTPATPIGALTVRNGQLASPLSLDPAQLAETIIELMSDSERRRQLGNQARQRAQLLYNIDRYIMELMCLYRHLEASPV
jgi:glycosyltransferase involved in cell wall biosynthesis